MDITSGFLVYKCRRCNELAKDLHVPDIQMALICAQIGEDTDKYWSGGTNIMMTKIHFCGDGYGVADLIGGER